MKGMKEGMKNGREDERTEGRKDGMKEKRREEEKKKMEAASSVSQDRGKNLAGVLFMPEWCLYALGSLPLRMRMGECGCMHRIQERKNERK